MALYLTALLSFGFTRGLHEGMIHIMHGDPMHIGEYSNGVRNHIWFKKWYHKIACLRDLAALLLGHLLITTPFNVYLLTGSACMLWELSEAGYSIARYGTIRDYEHINFADFVSIKITGWKVMVLHIARGIIGITLLILGL
jgi:hypothetical protein